MINIMTPDIRALEGKVSYVRAPNADTPPEPGMVRCDSFPWCGNWVYEGKGYKDHCTLECYQES
jgi:hypothetical protein